jgi:nicotinate-nucleotide adenylyltransferase
MKIGLYFGSFNPIHIGHLIIAQHMLNTEDLNEVWFIVSPQNPFKHENQLLDASHRLFLVRAAIEDSIGFKASNVEFSLPKPSYTINTLIYLEEKYPSYHFNIIMGGDSYQNIGNWKNGEIILRKYPLLVYERPGYPITLYPQSKTSISKAPFLDVSASLIRDMIKKGSSLKYLVPDEVIELIKTNHFYV